MSEDFRCVRQSAIDSRLARSARRGRHVFAIAWRTSVIGRRMRHVRAEYSQGPVPSRIRWWATTLAVAAAGHLVLRPFLSATVAPALPALGIAGAGIAAGFVAWQAAHFHHAWHRSRLARLFG